MIPPTCGPHKYNGQYGPGFINMMTPGDRCLLSYSFKDNGHFDKHLVVFHLTISVWLERVVACSTGHVTPIA